MTNFLKVLIWERFNFLEYMGALFIGFFFARSQVVWMLCSFASAIVLSAIASLYLSWRRDRGLRS